MGYYFVSDVFATALTQKFLQTDDGRDDEGDLTDDQGFAGDQGDLHEGEFTKDCRDETETSHHSAHHTFFAALLLSSGLFCGQRVVFFVFEGFGHVTERSCCGRHCVHDVTTLEVDLDGVAVQEAGDAAEEQRLDGVLTGDGARRTFLIDAGLDDLHTVRHCDGVLLAQRLVDVVVDLVLEAGHGVFAHAVVIDGVQEVVLRLDGVRSRFFIVGRKGTNRERAAQK